LLQENCYDYTENAKDTKGNCVLEPVKAKKKMPKALGERTGYTGYFHRSYKPKLKNEQLTLHSCLSLPFGFNKIA
jgi:hypothetical protein